MAKAKRIWDNYEVIGEVQKTDAIKFVIAAAIRDGVKYINVREFYLRKTDEVWRPGRDGITIPIVYPIKQGTELIRPYDELSKMFLKTSIALKTMELFDEEKAVYKEDKESKKNADN